MLLDTDEKTVTHFSSFSADLLQGKYTGDLNKASQARYTGSDIKETLRFKAEENPSILVSAWKDGEELEWEQTEVPAVVALLHEGKDEVKAAP